jgi:hypothetical protein
MAQSTARPEAAVDLQMVREFLERYFRHWFRCM